MSRDLTSFNVHPLPHDYAGISGSLLLVPQDRLQRTRAYLELIFPQDNDDD